MTELRKNQILYTKDGRKIGNAIVIKYEVAYYWKLKTDYGNIVNLKLREIKELFYLSKDGLMPHEIKLIENNHKHSNNK